MPLSLRTFLSRARAWSVAHKFLSALILVAVIGGAYGIVKATSGDAAETSYVLATATVGTVVQTVSGTGQVSASDTVELSAKASGTVTSVPVKVGDTVRKGQLIASIDATDAALELSNARLAYADTAEIDPDDLAKAKASLTDAETGGVADLAKSYATLVDALSSLDTLYAARGYLSTSNAGMSSPGRAMSNSAQTQFYAAQKAVKASQQQYQSVTAASSDSAIEAALSSAYDAAKTVAAAASAAQDAVQYIRDRDTSDATAGDTAWTTVTGLVSSTGSAVSTLSSAKQALITARNSYNDLADGPDTQDVNSAQLSLRSKQQAYDDHFVVAPFDGVIAKLPIKAGDTASSGTAVATVITPAKVVELSLNEVDAAKVQAGDKATVTFDAIDGLTIAGEVAEVASVGTVSNGVVDYDVKVALSSDDDRVKPGMTATAVIITERADDVLTVASSAVHTAAAGAYVLVLPGAEATSSLSGVPGTPVQQQVTVGLSGDDTTEITSGLAEGDSYVARTISGSSVSAATTGSARTGGSASATRATGVFVGGGGPQ